MKKYNPIVHKEMLISDNCEHNYAACRKYLFHLKIRPFFFLFFGGVYGVPNEKDGYIINTYIKFKKQKMIMLSYFILAKRGSRTGDIDKELHVCTRTTCTIIVT